MAKHHRKPSGAEPRPGPALKKHLNQLGINRADTAAYLRWCARRGFAEVLKKTPAEREAELARHRSEMGLRTQQQQFHRRPAEVLRAAVTGDLDASAITRPGWAEAARELAEARLKGVARDRLLELLDAACARGLRFEDPILAGGVRLRLVTALIALARHHRHWISSTESWRVTGKTALERLASLANTLLAPHPVPVFLAAAWARGDSPAVRHRDLYLHLAAGESLRSWSFSPALSRKACHHFLTAPEAPSVEQAIWYAYARNLGAGAAWIRAWLGTRVLRDRMGSDASHEQQLERQEFWATVFAFALREDAIHPDHLAPLTDFLHEMKFEERSFLRVDGARERVPPPMPNLSMKGRDGRSLLVRMEAWHRSLGALRMKEHVAFPPSGIPRFVRRREKTGPIQWTIQELTSSTALFQEGRRMRHCVASYARHCVEGRAAIFSLSSFESGAAEGRITIEVVAGQRIVQARGRCNRLPTVRELDQIHAWARQAHLSVEEHVIARD